MAWFYTKVSFTFGFFFLLNKIKNILSTLFTQWLGKWGKNEHLCILWLWINLNKLIKEKIKKKIMKTNCSMNYVLQGLESGWRKYYNYSCQPVDYSRNPVAVRVCMNGRINSQYDCLVFKVLNGIKENKRNPYWHQQSQPTCYHGPWHGYIVAKHNFRNLSFINIRMKHVVMNFCWFSFYRWHELFGYTTCAKSRNC